MPLSVQKLDDYFRFYILCGRDQAHSQLNGPVAKAYLPNIVALGINISRILCYLWSGELTVYFYIMSVVPPVPTTGFSAINQGIQLPC